MWGVYWVSWSSRASSRSRAEGCCQSLRLIPLFWSGERKIQKTPVFSWSVWCSILSSWELQEEESWQTRRGAIGQCYLLSGLQFWTLTGMTCVWLLNVVQKRIVKTISVFQSSPWRVCHCCVGLFSFPSSNHSFAKPGIPWWETGVVLRFWQGCLKSKLPVVQTVNSSCPLVSRRRLHTVSS